MEFKLTRKTLTLIAIFTSLLIAPYRQDCARAESEPFPVTLNDLTKAFVAADRLGSMVSGEIGDKAYRDLHP